MDFIVGLLESHMNCHAKPYDTNLVIVDWYTKLVCYYPCCNLLDIISLAKILAWKLVLRGASVLRNIVSYCRP